MSPASSSAGAVPGRSQIENWDIDHLEGSAGRWRASATEFEDLFALHRQNISAPGGTEWEGTANDAALDRVTADTAVVTRHAEIVCSAADLADASIGDLRAAQRAAITAIAEAEADGFRVGEDLSVTDTRRIDVSTMADRYTAAVEHAENIRWNASQLLATDTLIGQRLTSKAAELNGIRFDGEGTIQVANFGGGFKESPFDDDPRLLTREQALAAWEMLESDKAVYRSRCTVRPFVLPNEQAAYQACLDDQLALDTRQAALEARLRELGVEILPPGIEAAPGAAGMPASRGLPPDGIYPPVEGKVTQGPASRPSEQARGGQSLWDEKGGEWRYFPGDKYHNPHWDYNPHNSPTSPWQNIAIGDLPPRTGP